MSAGYVLLVSFHNLSWESTPSELSDGRVICHAHRIQLVVATKELTKTISRSCVA